MTELGPLATMIVNWCHGAQSIDNYDDINFYLNNTSRDIWDVPVIISALIKLYLDCPNYQRHIKYRSEPKNMRTCYNQEHMAPYCYLPYDILTE